MPSPFDRIRVIDNKIVVKENSVKVDTDTSCDCCQPGCAKCENKWGGVTVTISGARSCTTCGTFPGTITLTGNLAGCVWRENENALLTFSSFTCHCDFDFTIELTHSDALGPLIIATLVIKDEVGNGTPTFTGVGAPCYEDTDTYQSTYVWRYYYTDEETDDFDYGPECTDEGYHPIVGKVLSLYSEEHVLLRDDGSPASSTTRKVCDLSSSTITIDSASTSIETPDWTGRGSVYCGECGVDDFSAITEAVVSVGNGSTSDAGNCGAPAYSMANPSFWTSQNCCRDYGGGVTVRACEDAGGTLACPDATGTYSLTRSGCSFTFSKVYRICSGVPTGPYWNAGLSISWSISVVGEKVLINAQVTWSTSSCMLGNSRYDWRYNKEVTIPTTTPYAISKSDLLGVYTLCDSEIINQDPWCTPDGTPTFEVLSVS